MIYRNWGKITAWFSKLWGNVKKVFHAVIDWFKSIGTKFYNAGKNMILSIWNGIKAFAMAPVNAVKNIVKKIRNLLPFSPAKEGPLKDIHKIKLVETIAASINSAPMLKAMKLLVHDIACFSGKSPGGIANIAGGSIVINSTLNVYGSADRNSLKSYLYMRDAELFRKIDEYLRRKERIKF